jgi:hypothetical protein
MIVIDKNLIVSFANIMKRNDILTTTFWQLLDNFLSHTHMILLSSLFLFLSPLFLTNKKWEKQGCQQSCHQIYVKISLLYYEIIQYVVIIRVMIFVQPFCDNLLSTYWSRERGRERIRTQWEYERIVKKLSQNGCTNIIFLVMISQCSYYNITEATCWFNMPSQVPSRVGIIVCLGVPKWYPWLGRSSWLEKKIDQNDSIYITWLTSKILQRYSRCAVCYSRDDWLNMTKPQRCRHYWELDSQESKLNF